MRVPNARYLFSYSYATSATRFLVSRLTMNGRLRWSLDSFEQWATVPQGAVEPRDAALGVVKLLLTGGAART